MPTRTLPAPQADIEDEGDLVDRRPLVYLVLAALVLIVYLLAGRIFVIVNVGRAAVLYRPLLHGLVLDKVYGEGLHINFPWDTMTVYDLRIQERTIDYPVLNGNGLELKVKVSVRYHPFRESLGFLHQQIGPDYEQKLVVPSVEYCVRNAIGASTVNDIYSNRGDMLGRIQSAVSNMLAQKYIVLDGLVFREIGLPPAINTAIQDKEEQRQILEGYEFRVRTAMREALRLQIDGTGRKGYNDIVRSSLDERLLKLEGIAATRDLSRSPNAKVVVIGSGPGGLPIILGNDTTPTKTASNAGTSPMSFSNLDAYIKKFERKILGLVESAPLEVTSVNAPTRSGSHSVPISEPPVVNPQPSPTVFTPPSVQTNKPDATPPAP